MGIKKKYLEDLPHCRGSIPNRSKQEKRSSKSSTKTIDRLIPLGTQIEDATQKRSVWSLGHFSTEAICLRLATETMDGTEELGLSSQLQAKWQRGCFVSKNPDFTLFGWPLSCSGDAWFGNSTALRFGPTQRFCRCSPETGNQTMQVPVFAQAMTRSVNYL